jgi:hemolysin activation/secretion protein
MLALACAALPCVGTAQVATPPPGAGSTLREITPPLRPPAPAPTFPEVPAAPSPAAPQVAGPTFVLRAVRFPGATVFSEADLQAMTAASIGQRVSLPDLEAIAERVTARYHDAGYLLARAIVPAQDVTDGNVEISVLEGRIGQVRIELDPATPVSEAQVRAFAARIPVGEPLQQATLSRVMLLLSDLPGVLVEASIESGEVAGSTDLSISLKARRRWDLSFDADNHGSRSTSEYRVGLAGRWNSPFGVGDNLDYRLQLGNGKNVTFGRIAYERPFGTNGLRVAVAASRLEYELGKDFAALDATGKATGVDLAVTFPFLRSRTRNLFGKLGLLEKQLEDRFGAVSVVNRKRIRGLSAGLVFENSDRLLGGGYTSAGLTMLLGRLRLESGQQRADDAALGRTAGRFTHWNYNLSRLNALTSNTSVFIGLAGQLSNRNLDSAEKISLGGPRGVRAYAPAEATADEGHILNAELRFSPTAELSLQAFYDWGRARLHNSPRSFDIDNTVVLRGYGIGAYWGSRDGFLARASLAWRDSARGSADRIDRRPRLYVQIGKAL